MSSSLLVLAAETGRHSELGMPPIGYAIVAFAILLSLLLGAFALRSLGTRHRKR